VVRGEDLAGLKARDGLFDTALLAAGTGVVGEFHTRLEVLYADVWMLRLYATRARGAPDDSGPAHAAHSRGAKTNSLSPYSGNLSTVQPRLFAAGSA
jgi:hypothetical protein